MENPGRRKRRKQIKNVMIKNFFPLLPIIKTQVKSRWKKRVRAQIATSKTAKEAFTLIYRTNYWGSSESLSGNGSSAASTEIFRLELAELIQKHGIKSMFDAPCGDFNWMRMMKFQEGFHYIGGDIVDDIIAGCNSKYATSSLEFIVLDFTRDKHPKTDLWLCRDGLLHLSNSSIMHAFIKFVESGTEYCLVTQYNNVKINVDIATGLTRHVNLLLPPFRLPPPRARLQDRPVGEEQRELGLWSRADIANAIAG